MGCWWFDPWCKRRMLQEEVIKKAVDEATTNMKSEIAVAVVEEMKKGDK